MTASNRPKRSAFAKLKVDSVAPRLKIR